MFASERVRRPSTRPRPRGLEVKPGSVLRARNEAGLSLADVAGAELSRTAIHLIETGRSRPTMRTLRLIARRTGKPLSFFLDRREAELPADRPHLNELEQLLNELRFEDAVGYAEALLRHSPSLEVKARATFLLGRARLHLRHGSARATLEEATALAQDLGDPYLEIECRLWVVTAAFYAEDPRGVELALETLADCRSLDPVPVAIEVGLLETIAAYHVSRHEFEDAVTSYEQALEVAGPLRDLARMSQMYDNLSITYFELNNRAKAIDASRKALSLWSVSRDERARARLENNLGMMLLKDGRLDEAETHLVNALQICEQLRLDQGSAHVLISLGELFLAKDALDGAARFLNHAADVSHDLGERLTEAMAHEKLAAVAVAKGDQPTVDREFQTAIRLLESANVPHRLRDCRVAYARALRERGNQDAAFEQWEAAFAGAEAELPEKRAGLFLLAG